MGSIPLPALDARPPQQQDPLEQFTRLASLKMLAQRQQLEQAEIQRTNLQNQLTQQQVQDQKLVQQHLQANPDATLSDAGKALRGKITLGTYTNLMDTDSKIRQQNNTATESEFKNRQSAHEEYQRIYNNAMNMSDQDLATNTPAIAQEVNAIPGAEFKLNPGQPLNKAMLQQYGQVLALNENYLKQEADKRKEGAETQKAQAETEKAQTETGFMKQMGGTTPESAAFNQYVRGGGQPVNYPGFKAAQTAQAELPTKVAQAAAEARATQPYKLELSKAEAAARFAMEGMAKPVYAYDPKTNTTELMDQTSALRAGLQPRPVTTKEIQDDTMLNNRLADVHQKIARYEQALQSPLAAGGVFSQSDATKIAQILGDDKFKAGAFGTELPVDWMNKLGQRSVTAGLSDAAQKRLVAYYNAREAMVGYNRVLSGSGRTNEQALQLQLQTLPNPIAPANYANESINQFRENLRIVGQGLPRIPGIKSPEEWEKDITNPIQQNGQPQQGGWGAQFGGVPHR